MLLVWCTDHLCLQCQCGKWPCSVHSRWFTHWTTACLIGWKERQQSLKTEKIFGHSLWPTQHGPCSSTASAIVALHCLMAFLMWPEGRWLGEEPSPASPGHNFVKVTSQVLSCKVFAKWLKLTLIGCSVYAMTRSLAFVYCEECQPVENERRNCHQRGWGVFWLPCGSVSRCCGTHLITVARIATNDRMCFFGRTLKVWRGWQVLF